MYQKWIRQGLDKGLTDIEIYAVRTKDLTLSVYNSKVEEYTKSELHEVSIRGIYNNKFTSLSAENLSDENIDKLLDKLIENAKSLTIEEPAIIYEGSKNYPEVVDSVFDFDNVPFDQKVEYLLKLESEIKKSEYVNQVEVATYSETYVETNLVNSKGLNLTRTKSYAYGYGLGIFQKNSDIKTAYKIKVVKKFDDFDPVKQAQETIEEGVSKLGGLEIKSGTYPVVFSNEKFASILAVFSSIFSGTSAYRKMTALVGKEGQKIALDNITLVDDPLSKEAIFQYAFDDQGVACKTKKIVENGVFKGFMHDLKTAAIFNVEPTGNSFGGRVSTTNFYLEPGDLSFDELIAPIEDGLYITDLQGLHAGVQPISGSFNLQASGFKIINGEVNHPVKMIVVSGNFFEILNSIKGLGNDLKISELNGYGSPSVYVGDLAIGGK
ncbi:MAG: TldD/PmbA family protein [Acholeplasmataceae bacterium]|jgi:PmbA protein